jgi:outer membrane protein OmpA-like peptidoglycan-associated protein
MNKTGILFLVTFLLTGIFSFSVQAQEDVRIKRREFKIEDKQGFKSAWKSRRKGDKFYDKGFGYYQKALDHFQEARDYNPDNAALNYKMGVCYLKLDKNEKAVEYFNRALAQDEEVALDIFYLLGRAYHLSYDFENAIRSYQRSLQPDIIKKLDRAREQINIYVRQCNSGKKLMKNPVRVNINNLGPEVNSGFDDYGPVFARGDSLMYFTSRRKHEDNDKRWLGDHKFYSDIYRAEKDQEGWKKAVLIHDDIYSSHNDAVVEATQHPRRIYVYRGHKDEGDIYYYEYDKDRDKWRGPRNFSRRINTNAKESSMCFTRDGSTLFFVSDMDGPSYGEKDIFMSRRDEKGKWSQPVNLGGIINSSLNEEGVFLNSTGDKLYFSSEGHNSMGGYDIFVSHRDVDGNWEEPRNLGYPVNTPGDDVLYRMVDGETNKAYYASVRDDNYGGKDLYEIIFLGEERAYSFTRTTDPIAWKTDPREDMLYRAPDKLAIDTTIYLVGRVVDTAYNEGIQAKLEIIDNERNQVVATHIADTNGRYVIRLPEQKKYGIEITSKDYLFFAQNIDLNQQEIRNDTIRKNFVLDKVEIGKKVVLENIYFETNSSKLKTSSYPELERVVRLMKDNPGIKLEISGHTDNVGSYLTNKRLSEARAKSVVEYLVEQGIQRSRLTYKGYSFTQPIASNDTPQGRQQNRRVEFKVLEK